MRLVFTVTSALVLTIEKIYNLTMVSWQMYPLYHHALIVWKTLVHCIGLLKVGGNNQH